MALALTERSARSTEIRCLKTAAAFALVLTDVRKGFCSWCFLPGLQDSSLLIWIKSNQRLGPPRCTLARGAVCTEHGETPGRAGAIGGCTQRLPPSRGGGPHEIGAGDPASSSSPAAPCAPRYSSGKVYPPPPCPHLLKGLRFPLLR